MKRFRTKNDPFGAVIMWMDTAYDIKPKTKISITSQQLANIIFSLSNLAETSVLMCLWHTLMGSDLLFPAMNGSISMLINIYTSKADGRRSVLKSKCPSTDFSPFPASLSPSVTWRRFHRGMLTADVQMSRIEPYLNSTTIYIGHCLKPNYIKVMNSTFETWLIKCKIHIRMKMTTESFICTK